MDLVSTLRALGGLLAVLALLGFALWAVRRWDISLPGRIGGARAARLALVERLAIDARRSLLLVRRDAAEHVLLIAPEGVIELGRGQPRADAGQAVAPGGARTVRAKGAAAQAEQLYADWIMQRRRGRG